MIILIRAIFCLALSLIISCNQPKISGNRNTTSVIDTFKKVSSFITNKDLYNFELASNIETMDLSKFQLYGKFFNNRIQFYTSHNIKSNILDAKVDHITLYFVDGVLAKSKYVLNENISSYLINTYGKFKFTPLNWKNRDLASTTSIIRKESGKYIIDAQLDSYRLKWDLGDKSLIYSNRDSVQSKKEKHIYSEVLNHYKEVFKEIELNESTI